MIGSGTIESACKQIVSHRLRCSGAQWKVEGARLTAKARAAWLSKNNDWNIISSMRAKLPMAIWQHLRAHRTAWRPFEWSGSRNRWNVPEFGGKKGYGTAIQMIRLADERTRGGDAAHMIMTAYQFVLSSVASLAKCVFGWWWIPKARPYVRS